MQKAVCLLIVLALASTPLVAQQPSIQESAKKAASQPAPASEGRGGRAKVMTGAILGIAGGTAMILGTTALRTSRTASGNTPLWAYDQCVALTSNPVYRNNDCNPLKGPNTPVVISGLAAAAVGVTLMMMGSSMGSVEFGAGAVRVQHKVRF